MALRPGAPFCFQGVRWSAVRKLRLSGGYGVDLADGRDAVGEPFNVAEIAAPSTVSSTVTT